MSLHSAAPAKARILLVEDNEINREIALEILDAAGLDTTIALNGREAIDKVKTQDFDLVLMDMQMPVLDGIAATRVIRALPGRRGMPIVAMTANAFDEDRHNCLAAGMDDFVAKPVDPRHFYDLLGKWLPTGRPKVSTGVTASTGEELLDRLAEIHELDVGLGMKITRNKPDFYVRLLRMFVAGHADDSSRLRTLLADGNHVATERLVHDLKGVAGNIGATHLHRQAEAALTSLRHHAPDTPRQVSELAEALDRLLARLSQTLA